jgi:DNA-binding transcriptional ArsR family regulator
MNATHRKHAEVLRALGHPVRYCIVEGLLSAEHNVAEMVGCTGVPQPTVSQHLAILKAAGIIECQRQGTRMLYSVCSPWARKVIAALK